MVNSPTTVVEILNGFPELDFDSSACNFEFPKMVSRNDSGVDSVMGLWSMMDRAVREKDSEKTNIGHSLRNTKVNAVKLDPFESSAFNFDDSFGWDNHSESKQIDQNRIKKYKSPNSPASPNKNRRRLFLSEAIDEALKQTNPTLVECNATKGSRNKCTTTLRKKVVEGRRLSTNRISRKDVDDYEENSNASFDMNSSVGDLSSVDQTVKRISLTACSERNARRSQNHQRGSIDAHLSHSSERVQSSSKSRADKHSNDAVTFVSCDLLGDHGEVKTSRRHSHTVIDEHEVSKGKRREKKRGDTNERRLSNNLSRGEKMIDSNDNTYQSPPQNRRRSLNFSVDDYIDPQQLQIERLCDKLFQMEAVSDRKQTLMTSTSEKLLMKKSDGGCLLTSVSSHTKMNMSICSNTDTPPKRPSRIVSPKATKKDLRRNTLAMLLDANKLDMMH